MRPAALLSLPNRLPLTRTAAVRKSYVSHIRISLSIIMQRHLMQRCTAGHIHTCPPKRVPLSCQHSNGAHHTVKQYVQHISHTAAAGALAISLLVSTPGEASAVGAWAQPLLSVMLVDQQKTPHPFQQLSAFLHSARFNESGRVPCKVDPQASGRGGGARLHCTAYLGG